VAAVLLASQPVDLVVHPGEAYLHGPDVPTHLFKRNHDDKAKVSDDHVRAPEPKPERDAGKR
jgi:hypothetical protein